jgi:hypothetical protein
MERLHVVFNCSGLRLQENGSIEAKFAHQTDYLVLTVPPGTHIALGHQYTLSMTPLGQHAPPVVVPAHN